MKKECRIVCPNACRNCGITPCADRMAEEETEEKQVKEAMKALGVDVTPTKDVTPKPMDIFEIELSKFFASTHTEEKNLIVTTGPLSPMARQWIHESDSATIKLSPPGIQGLHATTFDDCMDDIKEAEALKHCGMRSDISCRHCHDDTCKIRKADRRF